MGAGSCCGSRCPRRRDAGAARPHVRSWVDARGQGIVEYALILGLSALLAVAILVFFGGTVADVVRWIGQTVDAATGG